MANKKSHVDSLKNKQIQQKANTLLNSKLESMDESFPDIQITVRSEEDQHDIGIDFSIELLLIQEYRSIQRFCIQNKGIEKGIKPLKGKPGYFSHSIKLRNAHYFFLQLNLPLIFTVCDLTSREVYWHAVQLDDDIVEKMEEAVKTKKASLTLHISMANKLDEYNFKRFVADTYASYREQSFRFQDNKNESMFQEASEFKPDATLPAKEQLAQVISHYFADLSYLPPKLWLSDNFFAKGKEAYREYEPILVTTDNEEWYNHIKEANDKNESSLQFLLSHHLRDVRLTKGRNETRISQSHIPIKRPLDNFKSLKWSDTLTELDTASSQSLEYGYLAYQLYDLPLAYAHCWSVQELNKKNRSSYKALIAGFNLGKLAKTIRFNYYEYPNALALIDKNITIDLAAWARKSDLEVKVINYIREQVFYTYFNNFISDVASSIITGYDSYLRGSASSNNYVLALKAAFSDLTEFFDWNFIMFDHFSEFRDLAHLFAEAMMAAHAVDYVNNSGLDFFDDWTLQHIVLYSNTENITNSFHKYSLQKIKYKKGIDDDDSFVKLFRHFLADYSSLVSLDEQRHVKLTQRFWENHDRILGNLLLLFAITELPEAEADLCIDPLIDFLEVQQSMHPRNFTFLKNVFDFKQSSFSKDQVTRLLNIFVSIPRYTDDRLIEGLIGIIVPGMLSVAEAEKILTLLIQYAVKMRALEDRYGDPEIICLRFYHSAKLPEIRNAVRTFMIQTLENKFDDDLYYQSVAYEVLEYEYSDYFKQYETYVRTKFNPNSFRMGLIGEDHFHTTMLDAFLDLCFQQDLSLDTEMCNWISGLGIFYDWLIHIESFDYSKFNPVWITPSLSSEFTKRITNSAKTRAYVQSYLRKNRDPRVEKAALRIFFVADQPNV